MGWASGTEIFDSVCRLVVNNERMHIEDRRSIITNLIGSLENADWDTQSESRYFHHPIVKTIMINIHPKWDWEEIEEDL